MDGKKTKGNQQSKLQQLQQQLGYVVTECVVCKQKVKHLAKGVHGAVCERKHFQCLYCNRKAERNCVICHTNTKIREFKDPRILIEERQKQIEARKAAERKAMERVMERLYDRSSKNRNTKKNKPVSK